VRVSKVSALAVLLVLLPTSSAHAIRPFITDDARVVGGGNLQLESWALVDAAQAQHWITTGFGPVEPLELTMGFVWGGVFDGADRSGPGIQGPLLQAKVLVNPMRADAFPGVALAFGTIASTSAGSFATSQWNSYAYCAVTQSFFADDLQFHANVGVAVLSHGGEARAVGGFGTQARVLGPLALVAEIVFGDILDPTATGGAAQLGYRLLFSEEVQLDGTFGFGLFGGAHEWWATFGIRLVAPRLYDPGATWNAPGHEG
jgi:hypothetical protein